ncbi:MAG: class I SAM-dependent methyltransferase [Planctomycetaceae bacterium]
MKSIEVVQNSVVEMYMSHPFPQWDHKKRLQRLPAELCRYRFLGFENDMTGARFLDVGCGTGNRSMLAAKHYGVEEFVGLDATEASLAVARNVARDEGFTRFKAVNSSLFEMPFEDNSFDVVVSWGVLHHTADPLKGLREMVRVCRPGGCVGIFVYNKFADWRHNLQKNRISRIAGDDFEKRFAVAHRLYGTKPLDQMTLEEKAVFYDQYCHPHKSDHSIGEVLGWLDEVGLEYSGSYPPLRITDTVRCLKYRAELTDDFPLARPLHRRIFKAIRRLPVADHATHFKPPTIMHRLFWNTVFAWQGRSGMYSHGVAVGGRKPAVPPANVEASE